MPQAKLSKLLWPLVSPMNWEPKERSLWRENTDDMDLKDSRNKWKRGDI